MFDVRQLTYFVAVIEEGGFSAAARSLNVAQSALSQNLQTLELELGHVLAIRHSRGIEPTAVGLCLLEHARGILAAVQAAKADVKGFVEVSQRTIRLGLPRSICTLLSDTFLLEWDANHPRAGLQISEQASSNAVRLISDGLLDVAVTSSPVDASTTISEGLLQERLCAILPSGMGQPFEEIRFSDLAKQQLILYTNPYVSRRLVESAARYNAIELNVVREINSVDLSLKLVEAGAGCTIQPFLSLRDYKGPAVVRPIVAPTIVRRLKLVQSRHAPVLEGDKDFEVHFREMLREEVTALNSHGLLELE
jgi:LysR family nitrogen assimilation transcriptional regulator